MTNKGSNKKRNQTQKTSSVRKEQVIMLRSQGFTLRQICDKLNLKSIGTVYNDIKGAIDSSKEKINLTVEQYRELELIRCDERFGRFADLRNKMNTASIPFERQIQLILSIEDRDMKNQEKLIYLLGLETIKAEDNDGFDINALRERAQELEKRDRELEMHPELTGRVR